MILRTCGTWPAGFSPAPTAESPERAISCPGGISRSGKCSVSSARRRRPICLPLGLARLAAFFYEKKCIREKKPLFFTPYAVAVLGSNGQFSHKKASESFFYRARPIEETLRDMTDWLLRQERHDRLAPKKKR